MLTRLGQFWGARQLHIAKHARAGATLTPPGNDKRMTTCSPSDLLQGRGAMATICSASGGAINALEGDPEGGRDPQQQEQEQEQEQAVFRNRDENRDRSRMLLVDANALVYRAYFGFQYANLSAKGRYEDGANATKQEDDFDTSSLFGFLRMLLMLVEIQPLPKYVSVVFDSKTGRSFRHELFPQYKANRENKTPEDLKEKLIPQIMQVVKALQLNTIEVENYEAGTLL